MHKVDMMEDMRKQTMMNRAVSDMQGGMTSGGVMADFESVLTGSAASKAKSKEDGDMAASGKIDARRTRFAIQM
jgi:hypothetical protein